MKIAQIVPGFGGSFYCENCLRDMELPRALQRLGHQVTVLPMYLPLGMPKTADADQPFQAPLFYGAIKVYLEEKLPFLRKAPAWLDRFLNAPGLLTLASKLSGSTRSQGLAGMTLSVLKGEKGIHAEELAKLVEWLKLMKPQVVHLSNALLMGLAGGIKNGIRVPVVCTLQDEDTWIDSMGSGADAVWDALKELVGDIDTFLPVSRTYGEAMASRLAIPPERIHVVYSGIQAEDYRTSASPPEPPTIGYLSRMCESQGLGVLVEAFLRMKRDPRLKTLKLKVTGGSTGEDRRFLHALHRRLHAAGAAQDVEFANDFHRSSRIRFLNSLSVLSVPAVKGEAFGLFILEALASGVPVVQPKVGGFPEIVEITEGGFLYEPNDASALADKLSSLLMDPEKLREKGARGRMVVRERFSIEKMARNTVQVYERCVS